jgi:osmoprotectant transport system permease protein
MTDFIAYWQRYHERLTTALMEHLWLVGVTLVLSIALAALITALITEPAAARSSGRRVLGRVGRRRIADVVQGGLAALYAVPSLALFALLIPLMGIGRTTALVALVAYNQFLLVRNFSAALAGVDSGLVEAAASLGMKRFQVFWTVQLPLALPVIMGGIRLAAVSTIGIATIAAVVGAKGLGVILFDGLRGHKVIKLVWGTALAAGLAVAANVALGAAERISRAWLGSAR